MGDDNLGIMALNAFVVAHVEDEMMIAHPRMDLKTHTYGQVYSWQWALTRE